MDGERVAGLPPIFIGGTGRSGTTITGRLLGHHPEYACPPAELKFHVGPQGLPGFLAGRRSAKELAEHISTAWFPARGRGGLARMIGRPELEKALRAFVRDAEIDALSASHRLVHDVMRPLLEAQGKQAWVEMTPRNAHDARNLIRMFPDLRLVHCLRDGRDVVASMLSLRWHSDALAALEWWSDRLFGIQRAVASLPEGAVHVLRLEDLVCHRRQETYTALLDWLGWDDAPEMRHFFETRLQPRDAHVGRWRRDLPPAVADALDHRYAEVLERLGAASMPLPAIAPPRSGAAARIAASKPVTCLEFVVIGAQKAGTTALWQRLRDQPDVWVPPTKEAPFFSHTAVYERGLASYLERLDVPSDGAAVRGTVTPHYMHGWREVSTATVAWRMAGDLPEVRIVALLRDPIERARSQYAMNLARGRDRRPFAEIVEALLDPRALSYARAWAHDSNSYVVQGEYGRILGDYLAVLPPARLHVVYTRELADRPEGTLHGVLGFLGVEARGPLEPDASPPAVMEPPVRLAAHEIEAVLSDVERAPRGERAAAVRRRLEGRVETSGLALLLEEIRRHEHAEEHGQRAQAGLRFFVAKLWNARSGPLEPIAGTTRDRLIEHYGRDLVRLERLTGRRPPWAESWTASPRHVGEVGPQPEVDLRA